MKPHPRLRPVALGASRLLTVVAAVMFVGTAVQALPPDTPPAGAITLGPASGDSSTPIVIRFAETPQFCPGDAIASFRWTTFIVPRATNIASMTFTPSGNPQAPAFSSALRDPNGLLVRAQPPGLGDGIVVPPLAVDFANVGFSTLTPGDYWMGIACTKSDGTVVQNERYWTVPVKITAAPGAGQNSFTYEVDSGAGATTTTDSTTTTTTIADTTTTTTTVSGGTTTTTVAGATTTTTLPGSTSGTVTPASPASGGAYTVTYPNCEVGETITFSQPASTPASVTSVCAGSAALTDGSAQALTAGTATGRFTAAPTAAGSYTVTMTGTVSAQRTTTFVIATASTPVSGGGSSSGSGGSTFATSGGTIPATGSSTTSLIVWGVLLLVFGRMAILLGRKPKVVSTSR